jgi:hypothetical protein
MPVPKMPLAQLAIRAAIRTILDHVSYTSALPEWFEVLFIDQDVRERKIQQLANAYLAGTAPLRPFFIEVPKKSGERKRWSLPSTNDQILLHACIATFAPALERAMVDRSRVFSYRLDPSRIAFVEDPISAWQAFQDYTHARCRSDECIMQLDFVDAFRRIDRPRLLEMVRKVASDANVARLVDVLLTGMAAGESGLPLVNDSVFFLGNAYLGLADAIISRHVHEFVRFVDDYRIFAHSRNALESLLGRILPDLERAGFSVHPGKLKVGTGQEYLEAVAGKKYSETTSDYLVSATVFSEVLQPGVLADQVKRTLLRPEDCLHEGFGRNLLAAVRRMYLNADIAFMKNYPKSPLDELRERLKGQELAALAGRLLKRYAMDPTEAWRTTCLVYLGTVLDNAPEYTEALQIIERTPQVAEVAKLWVTNHVRVYDSPLPAIEEWHGYPYLERGRRCQEKTP